jgi:hypothetical protein
MRGFLSFKERSISRLMILTWRGICGDNGAGILAFGSITWVLFGKARRMRGVINNTAVKPNGLSVGYENRFTACRIKSAQPTEVLEFQAERGRRKRKVLSDRM